VSCCFTRAAVAPGFARSDGLHPPYPPIRQADLDTPGMIPAREDIAHNARDSAACRLVLLEDDVHSRARDDFPYCRDGVVVARHCWMAVVVVVW